MAQSFDPILEMTDMARAVSRLLGEPAATASRYPIPVDLFEAPDAVEITAYLPGVRREDVKIELAAGVLVLRAERALPQAGEGRFLQVESPYGHFERHIAVGTGVQADGAEATWRDGTLTVRLPKSDALRPRTIAIADGADAPPALGGGADA